VKNQSTFVRVTTKNLYGLLFLIGMQCKEEVFVLSCPVLLMTGQRSAFNSATRAIHQAVLRSCEDKAKVEFIEVAGVANILQEKVFIRPPGTVVPDGLILVL